MAYLNVLLILAKGHCYMLHWLSDLLGWISHPVFSEGVDLEQEDDAVRFLGIHIKRNPKTRFLNMAQKGLIKWVLETISLDVGNANEKFTPAKGKPHSKHAHGEPVSGKFNYSSVVEMFLYLAGHWSHLPWHYLCYQFFCHIYVLSKACAWTVPQANWPLSESYCW